MWGRCKHGAPDPRSMWKRAAGVYHLGRDTQPTRLDIQRHHVSQDENGGLGNITRLWSLQLRYGRSIYEHLTARDKNSRMIIGSIY